MSCVGWFTEILPSNKATADKIQIKVLKDIWFSFQYLKCFVREALLSEEFPDSLNLSKIVPIHKKNDSTEKI